MLLALKCSLCVFICHFVLHRYEVVILSRFPLFRRLDLKRLILALAFFGVMLTLGNALLATHKVQKSLLIADTLEANRVYALKVANVTDLFLNSAMSQLEYSATHISVNKSRHEDLQQELNRLLLQTDNFNSSIIVHKSGRVVAVAPDSLNLAGEIIEGELALKPIALQQALISDPFISPAGNLIISLSQPLYDDNGIYYGFLAAGIYLQSENAISQLLEEHHYQDGSYLYVVDQANKLIFHRDEHRIGEEITDNAMIQKVIAGHMGSMHTHNSLGVDMLGGYAPVQHTKWGVVAQTPVSELQDKIDSTVIKILCSTVPLMVVTLLVILFVGSKIAQPLSQLAQAAKDTNNSVGQRLKRIKAWYFEASYLKRTIMASREQIGKTIEELDQDRQKDQMTNLLNRRGIDYALQKFSAEETPFAVLALDIDHFKRVNDTYGHDVGDSVIKKFAELMQQSAREQDLVCRCGGEEFFIFLPRVHINLAYKIAERLRNNIADYDFDQVGHITTSIGIAKWPDTSIEIHSVLKMADRALYSAKESGRNCTVIAS